MPITRKTLKPSSSAYQDVVNALVAELTDQSTTGPQIIEEEQFGGYLHVTVIWDAWNGLSPEERGRAIMDAYERTQPADILRITIALGLTSAEAKHLGVAV